MALADKETTYLFGLIKFWRGWCIWSVTLAVFGREYHFTFYRVKSHRDLPNGELEPITYRTIFLSSAVRTISIELNIPLQLSWKRN